MKVAEFTENGIDHELIERWEPYNQKTIMFQRKEKNRLIPSKQQYQDTLKRLIEDNKITAVLILRMGGEMGLSRLDIANAEISNIDRYHKRGLWINISKHIRRNNHFVMRSRDVPINVGLYSYIKNYIDPDKKYIIKRLRERNIGKPMHTPHINWYYRINNVDWSPHKSRHYFTSQVKNWMRANRCYDIELIKDYLGHSKSVTESYGELSWEYKIDVIDQVFS